MSESIEKGAPQLDSIMKQQGWSNHDLVAQSTEQLTHKNVAKARKGKAISKNIQMKILNAINLKSADKKFTLTELFNHD